MFGRKLWELLDPLKKNLKIFPPNGKRETKRKNFKINKYLFPFPLVSNLAIGKQNH